MVGASKDDATEQLTADQERLRQRVSELETELAAIKMAVAADQQALREEASFRSSIIARAAEGLCVCHAVEPYPYVRFTVWNDRMTELTGYTMDEINRLGWYQTVYPDPETSARAQQRMSRMRDGDDLIAEEWEITRSDGQRRVLSISTSLLLAADGQGHVLALMQDTTDRRRAEQALRESEARYRATVQQAPVGIISIDLQGRVVSANPAYCEILGYSEKELLGRTGRDFAHPGDLALAGQSLAALLRGEAQTAVFEQRLLHRSRCTVWVKVTVSLLRADSGEIIQGIAVVQDISRLKAAEQERERLQAQMQHAQKLESLGVLAGGIAHDFNNLLCGMLGSADLALLDLEPGHAARSDLEVLKGTAQRATELCRQMLAYSGKGKFVIEPIDLSWLIEQMSHLLQVSVAKKATLRFDLCRGLPAVEADATQLRQVILNLLVNASEAMGDSPGAISVATGVTDCDRAYLSSVYFDEHLPEDRYVFIEVADTGCGMDPETQAKIFDPFFTTKFAGRGLGLAATLGIVRGHHGAIKVYSELGKGTTIKVLLPASSRTAVVDEQAPRRDVWRGRGLVLLVDDEPTVRDVGRRMLERLGFEVLVAEDGDSGVRLFREHADQVRVVILDMTMPKLSGEEAFREMRRIRPAVRVILTSGYNEQDATNRFAGKGLAGFIQKPFQVSALRDKLRLVLQQS